MVMSLTAINSVVMKSALGRGSVPCVVLIAGHQENSRSLKGIVAVVAWGVGMRYRTTAYSRFKNCTCPCVSQGFLLGGGGGSVPIRFLSQH
jgi:hypothetical protein